MLLLIRVVTVVAALVIGSGSMAGEAAKQERDQIPSDSYRALPARVQSGDNLMFYFNVNAMMEWRDRVLLPRIGGAIPADPDNAPGAKDRDRESHFSEG